MGIIDRLKKSTQGEEKAVKKPASLSTKKNEKKDAVEPTEQAVKKSVKREDVPMHSIAYGTLRHPVLSEKSAIHESNNSYTFVVANNATKLTVKRAVKDVYGVNPLRVNIINTAGRIIRSGKVQGRKSGIKKAIVTLKNGEAISIHEGV